jgi:hypothetical protein
MASLMHILLLSGRAGAAGRGGCCPRAPTLRKNVRLVATESQTRPLLVQSLVLRRWQRTCRRASMPTTAGTWPPCPTAHHAKRSVRPASSPQTAPMQVITPGTCACPIRPTALVVIGRVLATAHWGQKQPTLNAYRHLLLYSEFGHIVPPDPATAPKCMQLCTQVNCSALTYTVGSISVSYTADPQLSALQTCASVNGAEDCTTCCLPRMPRMKE